MVRKIIGFVAFAATSISFLFFSLWKAPSKVHYAILVLITVPTLFGLLRHWFECTDCSFPGKHFIMDKNKYFIFISAFIAVVMTWFMNHEMGLGAFVANGTIGLIAATLLPTVIAGTAYAASFVGMSSLGILPNIQAACIAGLVVGIVLVLTEEIYAGIGGKGGTSAALSTHLSRFFIHLLK